MLAEQWITGQEFTAGILGAEALPLIRLETPNTFYDYDAKYQANTTRYLIPCGLEAAREQVLQTQALARVPRRRRQRLGTRRFHAGCTPGRPWFIEVNTVPGLTDHSLVPMAARASGHGFHRPGVPYSGCDAGPRIAREGAHDAPA